MGAGNVIGKKKIKKVKKEGREEGQEERRKGRKTEKLILLRRRMQNISI